MRRRLAAGELEDEAAPPRAREGEAGAESSSLASLASLALAVSGGTFAFACFFMVDTAGFLVALVGPER